MFIQNSTTESITKCQWTFIFGLLLFFFLSCHCWRQRWSWLAGDMRRPISDCFWISGTSQKRRPRGSDLILGNKKVYYVIRCLIRCVSWKGRTTATFLVARNCCTDITVYCRTQALWFNQPCFRHLPTCYRQACRPPAPRGCKITR